MHEIEETVLVLCLLTSQGPLVGPGDKQDARVDRPVILSGWIRSMGP